ncbi:Hypothetical_protein [Hexamita inflata]|uniref:Hypothetical_protein n=1 Tax=Hexamita inflata TaxID=28002 RepID=A0AA86PU88_9EUKA|nr:Hypothetical protein HINF_LOCUS32561 [Hexamita inflata]
MYDTFSIKAVQVKQMTAPITFVALQCWLYNVEQNIQQIIYISLSSNCDQINIIINKICEVGFHRFTGSFLFLVLNFDQQMLFLEFHQVRVVFLLLLNNFLYQGCRFSCFTFIEFKFLNVWHVEQRQTSNRTIKNFYLCQSRETFRSQIQLWAINVQFLQLLWKIFK